MERSVLKVTRQAGSRQRAGFPPSGELLLGSGAVIRADILRNRCGRVRFTSQGVVG